MDPAWVFRNNSNDLPEWARNQPARTEVQILKKLEVKVVMCCSICVEKVEEAVSGMAGVFDFKIDRWKDRLTIHQSPNRGPNHKQLVKKLKRATHDRIVEILESNSSTEDSQPGTTTTTTVFVGHPAFGPGYYPLSPWPPSSASSSNSPFIMNPNYFQHPVGCYNCMRYPGAVCANCGRSSQLGAMSS